MAPTKSDTLIVWQRAGGRMLLGARCANCNGLGRLFLNSSENPDCECCDGRGWFGVDPELPVLGFCGSVEKIAMLTVRYATGVPLWNQSDGIAADADSVQRVLHPKKLPDPAILSGKRRRGKSSQPRTGRNTADHRAAGLSS